MNYASFLFLICLIRTIRALKSLLILTITTKPKTKKLTGNYSKSPVKEQNQA